MASVHERKHHVGRNAGEEGIESFVRQLRTAESQTVCVGMPGVVENEE
jgi:hypothetical protein